MSETTDPTAAGHTHETGGAWHLMRWRVEGCPTCNPPATPDADENIVQRIADAWDCCGTCAGGVLAAYTRDRVAAAEAKGRADVVAGVRAWCAINEIAEPPLDWTGLGEFLDARDVTR